MSGWENLHCNVVEINGCGVLIKGASGSGKSSLSLGLLELAAIRNVEANLVCDDQALLQAQRNVLIAKAPENIAGKIELRGLGIVSHSFIESSTIGVVAELVDDNLVERMPKPQTTSLLGVELPFLLLPLRHELMARRIVFGWIDKCFSS